MCKILIWTVAKFAPNIWRTSQRRKSFRRLTVERRGSHSIRFFSSDRFSMRRLPTSSLQSSVGIHCSRCIRHRQYSDAFRLSQSPSYDVSKKRNLSQLSGSTDTCRGPFNALLHSHPPTESITSAIPGITHDVLDKMFERSPLWQSPSDQRFIIPSLNSDDPEGVQKYLRQRSSVPKNTVELLTVLDALIAQDDLARAATVVASLRRQLDPNTPLSTLVYNKYLEGVISSSILKSGGIGRAMEWYQEMVKDGVKADRTTFALLAKVAFALASVSDGNRAARKIFGLWRSQGGEVGDLLCDLVFPQEEIIRSLKVSV